MHLALFALSSGRAFCLPECSATGMRLRLHMLSKLVGELYKAVLVA